jgi:hypothetical protein
MGPHLIWTRPQSGEFDDTDNSLIGYSYNPDGTLAVVNEQVNATTFAATTYTYDDYKRLKTVSARCVIPAIQARARRVFNQLSGHLFQGRYKGGASRSEEKGYFTALE